MGIKESAKSSINYMIIFVKWILLAAVTGVAGGLVGSFFHIVVELATDVRVKNPIIIWLLPLGGLLIVFLYNITGMSKYGVNQVLYSTRTDKKIPIIMTPLIIISTFITHLFGGSAGREGAALLIGGSLGYKTGKIFKLDEKDLHVITLCGMSCVFAALFGTPVTAAVFVIEVVNVGMINYSAIIPCIISSLSAFGVSLLFGIKPVKFILLNTPNITVVTLLQAALIGVLCAVLSIIFCVALKKTEHYAEKYLKNSYIRVLLGGIIIAGATFLLGSFDYNGAGMNIITTAISGSTKPSAFILKLLFTVITVSTGYKGGEIVPTFFVGATFGCFVGGLIGIDAGLGAAIGLVALFCGMVNCPLASIILSVELFGSEGLLLFALASCVSYMLSGYFSLYDSQKFIYSKIKDEYTFWD